MRAEAGQNNENLLIGIESHDLPGELIAVKPIAGLIARRIVSWVGIGEEVACGQRLGLIQFGSRCDLYLPLSWHPTVKPGDKVRGGETVVARRNTTPLPPPGSANPPVA